MSMDNFHTLTQLLDNAGCQYKIFDLGRRVCEINVEQFKAVEENRQPYPWPLQQHAHLSISFWQAGNTPWIWFLRLPLDERGLLKQAAVGDFIKYVIEAMGATLNSEPTEEEQEKLAANPYTFKPSDDKMAIFHAQLRQRLSLSSSQYYEHAQHYLTGDLGWEQWQAVGLQGLADVCARMKQENNTTLLRKGINKLPMTPLYALLGCLEHCELPQSLAERLQERLNLECEQAEPDLFLIAALLRAMAGIDAQQLNLALKAVLSQPKLCHPEVLVAIAGRCWNGLTHTDTAGEFLLRLAQTNDQVLFNQLFTDLVMLPLLRGIMLQVLHSQANPELVTAITQLQQHARSQ
ncbi:DUF3549 family protein [Photobacterium sanguinicancri]|uniref:DUF3549 domain-containing protein n=1 Tax=Photobacterium sanguinicancri TaxID=875932 RepID=A0AAW7YBD2_9GAMM|nr:DUF3549 family protein [Photobacterium sanguinicancri]KXI22884.1 hypothetical protein AS132_10890 [Photobacterium sanguinicancri]MDO6544814.1 DUF3549 family protein [Photobacterium sanguinicancri]OZS45745.1 DUF3549 domain-containing protein [Photobacterium sanguinicancri]